VATTFATLNLKPGCVPVIFKIFLDPEYEDGAGTCMKYLSDKTLSAFPDEQEILLADYGFKVAPGKTNFQEDEDGALVIQLYAFEW